MAYATSTSSPVDREGYLWKRGEVNKNFQKRYFILRGNLLFYCEKKGDKDPIGVIILEGCSVELAEEEQEKFAFKIVFHGEGRRSYILGTECQDNLEKWMKILACSSYDYMKLMVMELEQQLAELEEAERHVSPGAPESNLSPVRSNPFDPSPLSDENKASKSWKSVHREAGAQISEDRKKWCDLESLKISST